MGESKLWRVSGRNLLSYFGILYLYFSLDSFLYLFVIAFTFLLLFLAIDYHVEVTVEPPQP